MDDELVECLREAIEALWQVRLDSTKYDENDATIEWGRRLLAERAASERSRGDG